jgi:3-oxoadipate enol-lactonase
MQTFLADGVRVEYQVRGTGEPLLLIHGGMIADSFEVIADKLAASYRLITYRRRGFHGSPPHQDCTISNVVADAIALLDHLNIPAAHIAGHSYGAVTALQLAIDAPMRAYTLGLLDACVMCLPSAANFGSQVALIAEKFTSGDNEEALIGILTLVGGQDPVQRLNKTLPPGWFDQAIADLPTLYAADLPSLGAWQFDKDHAATITQPALTLTGSDSAPIYADTHELLNQWLPNAEPFVVEGATHMLHWEYPQAVAAGLLAFLAHHPMD